jgi:hypothetical protein
MYSCEYALTQYKASAILLGNGEPAVVRNPQNVPYMCKHLYAAVTRKGALKKLQGIALKAKLIKKLPK